MNFNAIKICDRLPNIDDFRIFTLYLLAVSKHPLCFNCSCHIRGPILMDSLKWHISERVTPYLPMQKRKRQFICMDHFTFALLQMTRCVELAKTKNL